MQAETKKPKYSPLFFIIIGLIYLLNPFDIPGPIDDIIVNVITCVLAVYTKKACDKFNEVIEEKTGVTVDTQSVLNSCVDNYKQAKENPVGAQMVTHKSRLDKMEDIFTNVTK